MSKRLVILGRNDWSNMNHSFCRTLRLAGWSAYAIITEQHPFGYPQEPIPEEQRAHLVQNADVLATSGDGDYAEFDRLVANYGPPKEGVEWVAIHAGSHYRNHPRECDAEDIRHGMRKRVFAPDLYRLVEPKSDYQPFLIPHQPIDKAIRPASYPLRVLHAPSQPERKGTSEIDAVCRDAVGIEYRKIVGRPAAEVSEALRTWADVLVDTLHSPEGNMGALATEAFCRGVAVVSDVRHFPEECRRWFLFPPIANVAGARELHLCLEHWAKHPRMCDAMKGRALEWAKEYLSPKGTAALWEDILA